MPALRVFGRRWYLGSDDLVTPSLLELTIRTLWFVSLMVVYFLQVDTNTCSDGYKIKLFYVGTMLFLVVYTVINVAIATISARGSIMDVYPRRHVESLLYLKFAVFVPEVAWTILATWWMFTLSVDCGALAIILAKAAVITEWIIIASILVSVYLMYDPLGRRPLKKRSLKDYKKMWHRRCRFMCCCLRRDENRADAFEEVATLFTLFFHGRDLVLTDILAGVILLSAKQRYERSLNTKHITDISEADTLPIRRCYRLDYHGTPILEKEDGYITEAVTDRHQVSAGSTRPGVEQRLSRSDSGADIQTDVQSGSENSVNAGQENGFCVQSERTRLYDRNEKPVPNYGASSRQGANPLQRAASGRSFATVVPSSGSRMSIDGDLCPGFAPPTGPKTWMTLENAAYYLRYATAIYGSSNYGGCYNCSDRIPLCRKYRCWRNDPHLATDVLKGDNYWECEAASVMLYCNLDRDDIIYADLDNQVFKTPYFVGRDDKKKVVVIAIRGTMSAGDALTDLTAQGEDIKVEHLPRGNVHKGIQKVAKKIKNQLENEIQLKSKIPHGYGLVITGHSLGAGVAAVLSLLIRDQYPDVICYAFSPPGGLVSLSLSFYLQDFVLTCFLGMDVVARLGVINMEKLKSDLLAVIKNSRLPKYKILSSGLLSMCCGCLDISDDVLLDDTETAELSGSVASDWEHVVWIDDDQERIVEKPRDNKDELSEQTCHGRTAPDGDTNGMSPGSKDKERRAKRTESGGGYQESTRTLSQESFASYDSRISTYSSASRYSSASGKNRRDNSDADSIISDSHAKWRRKQKNKKVGLAATDPLYLPGQILYLYEDEELAVETCCHSETVYKARWARAEEFDSIQLHSKMMYHHNPYTVDEALQQILDQGQGFAQSATAVDVFGSQYDQSPSLGKSFDSGIRCEGCVDNVDARNACEPRTETESTAKTVNQGTSSTQQIAQGSLTEKPNDVNCVEGVFTNLTSEQKQTDPSETRNTSAMVRNSTVHCKEVPTEVPTHYLERTNTKNRLDEGGVGNGESAAGMSNGQFEEYGEQLAPGIEGKHPENDRQKSEMPAPLEEIQTTPATSPLELVNVYKLVFEGSSFDDDLNKVTPDKDDHTKDNGRLTEVAPPATTPAHLTASGDDVTQAEVIQSCRETECSDDRTSAKMDNAMTIAEQSPLKEKRYDGDGGVGACEATAAAVADTGNALATTLDTTLDNTRATYTADTAPIGALVNTPASSVAAVTPGALTAPADAVSTIATSDTLNTSTTTVTAPTAPATSPTTAATTPTTTRNTEAESDDDELVYFTI